MSVRCAFLAEASIKSPRFFIYFVENHVCRIKVFNNTLSLISKKASLVAVAWICSGRMVYSFILHYISSFQMCIQYFLDTLLDTFLDTLFNIIFNDKMNDSWGDLPDISADTKKHWISLLALWGMNQMWSCNLSRPVLLFSKLK